MVGDDMERKVKEIQKEVTDLVSQAFHLICAAERAAIVMGPIYAGQISSVRQGLDDLEREGHGI